MSKNFEMPVWVSNCCGFQRNCRYPNAVTVTDAEELKEAVKNDHVFISFKNNYRGEDNFIFTDTLVVDCDNSHSNNKEEWIDVSDIRRAFPGVGFVIYTSRNHMKQKGDSSPRPRYHVIFFVNRITDPAKYKAMLKMSQEYFPYFDTKALDAGRFFYGSPETEVIVTEGVMNLTQFFDDEEFSKMGEEIREGNRNATMFKWAVRSMKRYGDTEESKEKFYMEADKCSPPLEADELATIWKSAQKYYKKICSQPDYVAPAEYNGTAPIKWEEPIPFSKFMMEKFPLDALPPAIASYVSAVAKSTQTPVDMAGSLALSVMSASLQGKYRIRGKSDWTEPLNTYTLVIAPPSERKSSVLHAMVRPLYEYESDYNRRNAAAVETSRMKKRILERRQKAIEDQVAKGKAELEELDAIAQEITSFVEIRPLKLYVDDITTEKLVSVLSDNNGRASLISSEGGIFDTLAGIYTKNVNIDVMLKSYSGDTIRVDRIGRESETILDPALTILLMAQPNVISEVLGNSTFRGRGLTARFLYCMPVSAVGSRDYRSTAMTEDIYREYERCIKNLLEDEYSSRPEIITLSPEADELLAEFADEIEPKLIREYSEIADWAGKLVGNTLRIAGLLCRAGSYRTHDLLDVPDELVVDETTINDAIRIGRYFLNHAQAAYSVLPEDAMYRKANLILEMIRENRFTEFDRRKAMRLCRSFKTVSEIQPVLDFLDDYGYIALRQNAAFSLGRPPLPRYEVNPWVLEH